ncbi:MAG: hypothetical protein IJL26_05495 [Clostridia bacterium]|nr:hypothetical protein [Clostridia bacterium]
MENYYQTICNLVSVIIGALIGLFGTYMSNRASRKQENEDWFRNHKYRIYTDLIGLLENITLPLIANEPINAESVFVDTQDLEEQKEELQEYVENNKGEIILFVPNDIYSRLVILIADIFTVVSSENSINLSEFNNSRLFKVKIETFELSRLLKDDLLPKTKRRK